MVILNWQKVTSFYFQKYAFVYICHLAKERDPGLYEAIVGRDRIGRPETMKFSDVLMRCWMQERDPDTDMRKIDQDNAQGKIIASFLVPTFNKNKLSKRTRKKKRRKMKTKKTNKEKLKKRRKKKKKQQVLI